MRPIKEKGEFLIYIAINVVPVRVVCESLSHRNRQAQDYEHTTLPRITFYCVLISLINYVAQQWS